MQLVFFGGHFLWSFFGASLGKFGQKSFAPPKICLLLHLWSEQFATAKWGCANVLSNTSSRAYKVCGWTGWRTTRFV